ncbi:head-tail connector protein [Cellulomonas uda]|uniref:Uncharacterized protein n=1 Tax=Cellulomonas uda TaxID=1714 RepID=A0A4Y3KAE5_CELUD|nr:head-tail connector protein [Cellulomonas uda]NII67815.1 hypothetical protein [Cellulomonas uda]GEA79938.1 hypothetical protein CUD01_03820 [Cellulomonas uda]
MPKPPPAITLVDAKEFLKISSDSTDVELLGFIEAATAAWVKRVGPVLPQQFVDTIGLPRPGLPLTKAPVISVESVTVDGVELAPTRWELDPDAGVIDVDGGLTGRRASVHYTAGYAPDDVPADLLLGVKLLLRHLWRTQRGAAKAAGGGEEETSASFLWPNRVEEIARDYRLAGFA